MKSLKDSIIIESWTDGQKDTSVKTPERKKVHHYIYNALDYHGTTGKVYHDESWEGVKEVTKVVRNALNDLNEKLKDGSKYEVSIAPNEGGYQKSKDGLTQWKQYKVEIYKVPAKYDEYPEPFMLGTLNCFAAGSMKDPFDAYDMAFCISY